MANTRHDDDNHYDSPTPARLWGDQWLRVSEKILTGLNHQLTNRSAALDSLVGVVAAEGELDRTMLGALQDETVRLIDLLRLYRLLPAEASSSPQAIRLQDVLPQLVRLHTHHADLRNVPVALDGDGNTDPILIRPSALMRPLLVLLESAAGNARRSGRRQPISLGYGPHGDAAVRIVLDAPAPVGQMVFTGNGSLVHAVRSTIAASFGELDATIVDGEDGPLLRYELLLPTLTEARRLEGDPAA